LFIHTIYTAGTFFLLSLSYVVFFVVVMYTIYVGRKKEIVRKRTRKKMRGRTEHKYLG